jgi:hypothetical protein
MYLQCTGSVHHPSPPVSPTSNPSKTPSYSTHGFNDLLHRRLRLGDWIPTRSSPKGTAIQQRIAELEVMPATGFESIPDSVEDSESSHPVKVEPQGELRVMIELGSLRVLEKQRASRAAVAERLAHGTNLPLNRVKFRRQDTLPQVNGKSSLECSV